MKYKILAIDDDEKSTINSVNTLKEQLSRGNS